MSKYEAPNREEKKEQGPVRSFSENYCRSMDRITLSPELRERILQLEKKKRAPRWLRVVKPVAAVAACFVVLAAVKNISGVNFSALSTAEAPETAADRAADTTAYTTGAGEMNDIPSVESADEDIREEISEDISEGISEDTENAGADSDNGVAAYSLSPDEAVPEENSQESAPSSKENDSGASVSVHIPPEVLGESIPSDRSAGSEEAESDNAQSYSSASSHMIVNPMVGYETLSEAEAVLGWSVKAPPLDDASIYLINGSLFEADWTDGSYYRMGKTELLGSDVSGDYNSYDYAETETIDGIHGSITVYLSGDSENSLTLLIWSDDTYSYAYYAGTPMTHEQTLDFLEEQLTNESQ